MIQTDTDRRILAERALTLARPVSDAAGRTTMEVVTFMLGGEVWGLEARLIWEVFQISELAPLPGAPPPVSGITPWHGVILPVLDLRTVLGISSASLADLGYALVVGSDRPALGVLADTVDEVRSVGEDELSAAAEGVSRHRNLLLGVTASALPVLDGAKLVERYG